MRVLLQFTEGELAKQARAQHLEAFRRNYEEPPTRSFGDGSARFKSAQLRAGHSVKGTGNIETAPFGEPKRLITQKLLNLVGQVA